MLACLKAANDIRNRSGRDPEAKRSMESCLRRDREVGSQKSLLKPGRVVPLVFVISPFQRARMCCYSFVVDTYSLSFSKPDIGGHLPSLRHVSDLELPGPLRSVTADTATSLFLRDALECRRSCWEEQWELTRDWIASMVRGAVATLAGTSVLVCLR